MKLAGVKVEGPNEETIIIPRGNGEDIVFIARAVLDYSFFEKLCPAPKPKFKTLRGGKKVRDTEAPNYVEAVEEHGKRRLSWIVIESLKATPELEWETVVEDDPSTWAGFEDELRASGFSILEVHRVIGGVLAANCLDEDKLDKARESFLASQRQATDQSSSQEDEQSDTPSGEAANASA